MSELSDDAVIVRGGTVRDPAALLEKLEDAILDGDGAVLSVYGVEEQGDLAAAVLSACRWGDIPHRQVQVARAVCLRQAGLVLVLDDSEDQGPCHYNVVFGNDPNINEVTAFIECFDAPMLNPTGGKRRTDRS